MSRDVPANILNRLGESVVYPFFAIDIDFDTGPLYVWSGIGDITINSKTYLGAGQLLNISSVEETTEIEAKGATITMSGIPSSFLALALTEPYQGRECRIYFGFKQVSSENWLLNSALWNDAGVWVDTALWLDTYESGYLYTEVFSGELDQMNISEEANTATIAVTVENVLIKLERPVVRRFTNEDQKSRFPNDKGLEFVASLQDKEIFWGRTAA